MNTQLFAKSEKELSPYFAVYREILTATGWKGWEQVKLKSPEGKMIATGEVLEVVHPFSCEDKILWCWMLDRFQFFKEGKNIWFDNQDEIAAYTGISVSTVKRFIKKLSVSGVLIIKPKPMGGARVSNSYVITKDLVLVQKEDIAPKAPISPQVERSEESNISAQPDVYVEPQAAGESWANESLLLEDYEGIEFSVENESSSYQEWETLPLEVVHEKPVNACPFATAPTKRFKPNGSVSDEMDFWCNKNQVAITNVDGQTVFKHKGERFVIKAGAFVEYKATTYKSSAPKTLAEASGMKHMEKCWEDSNESLPF
ncbi:MULTISPECIES: hypothetical protein [Pseudomonas]|uniref:hypothetical protein n=1 Tax=Pseudomonas TaxID=286 RepID=UPI0012FC3EB2|nr:MULTISPECIES: hypothetical protein [Pseudomonas]MDC7829801.1 hypothetical protein [Pseudomonas benzopyrenica]